MRRTYSRQLLFLNIFISCEFFSIVFAHSYHTMYVVSFHAEQFDELSSMHRRMSYCLERMLRIVIFIIFAR